MQISLVPAMMSAFNDSDRLSSKGTLCYFQYVILTKGKILIKCFHREARAAGGRQDARVRHCSVTSGTEDVTSTVLNIDAAIIVL